MDRTEPSELASPRIAELERELREGNVGALEAFWRQTEAEGTPLIEPIEGDDDHSLVTFVWREQEGVERVGLGGGPKKQPSGTPDQLRRLAESESLLPYLPRPQ